MCERPISDKLDSEETANSTGAASSAEVQSSTHENEEEDAVEKPKEPSSSFWTRLVNFYFTYEFLILVLLVILLARAYPPLGADYLQPEITATWIAVIFIFVLAGLGLKTSEFAKALQRLKFNVFVQAFNFGVVSSITFGFSRAMVEIGALSQNLADGMVICTCLPLTINMVLVLTKAGGGDEASAIFNAAFGNLVGVFLSPLLILMYLGVTGDVDLGDVFYKLGLRVVLPLFVGQVLQKTNKGVVKFVQAHKKFFKKAQMYTLVFIVYTVFCRTFDDDESSSSVGEIFLMIAFQFLLLCTVMVLAWYSLKLFFPDEPTLRVMGLFGCTHKTVAMGIPLINAIYEGNSNIGAYTLPLLIWHPMQLIIGSALAPRLVAFVDAEKERLGIDQEAEGELEETTVSQQEETTMSQQEESNPEDGMAQEDATIDIEAQA